MLPPSDNRAASRRRATSTAMTTATTAATTAASAATAATAATAAAAVVTASVAFVSPLPGVASGVAVACRVTPRAVPCGSFCGVTPVRALAARRRRCGTADAAAGTATGAAAHPRCAVDVGSQTPLPAVVEERSVVLPTGVTMAYHWAAPPPGSPPPAALVVALHGSFHGGWAYAPAVLPALATAGYAAAAPSLRGTAATAAPPGTRAVKVGEHVADVAALIEALLADTAASLGVGGEGQRATGGAPPSPLPVYLIAHSFGAFPAYAYAAATIPSPTDEGDGKGKGNGDKGNGGGIPRYPLAGLALLAPSPPSGNDALTWRVARSRGLRVSADIFAAFALRRVSRDAALARRVLFGAATPDETVDDAMPRLAADTAGVGLDLADVRRVWVTGAGGGVGTMADVATAEGEAGVAAGEATWVAARRAAPGGWHAWVAAGGDDVVVDETAAAEAAAFVGASAAPRVYDGLAHDLMLVAGREAVVADLVAWVDDAVAA
ncbi:hypothetical protein MMPV_008567 [Pyropia vietnamensis]